MVRLGVRLRWVGDGTGRLTMRDLWALVNSFLRDETSALFRAFRPDTYVPPALALATDQLNATMLLVHTLRKAHGGKATRSEKFKPIRSYPGSPFDRQKTAELIDPAARIGGYKRMSRTETVEWLRSRGLPTPT